MNFIDVVYAMIDQATLGFGESLKSSVVQCNVGNRSPVLLCVLLPGRVESSHIELEFQEADDVVFSVVGPRSVHLTGYYVRENRQSNNRSDTYPCSCSWILITTVGLMTYNFVTVRCYLA